ncbi:hypothetical protein JHK85_010098 [Glycine max]|nr:hypothetical protein JHK85_010098 [Glycine max]
MKVKVHFYDDKPLSASVPKRVTCIVKEAIAATSSHGPWSMGKDLISMVFATIGSSDLVGQSIV